MTAVSQETESLPNGRHRLYRDRRVQILLLLGLTVRIALAWHHSLQGIIPDTNEGLFWGIGRRWAQYGEYGVLGWPGLYMHQGPAYSGVVAASVALFGASTYLPALVFQSVLSVAAVVVLADLFGQCLRRAGQPETVASMSEQIAVVLLVFSPLSLLYDRLLMSESIATTLLIASCAAWQTAEWARDEPDHPSNRRFLAWKIVTGILIAFAALAKPILLFLPGAWILLNIMCLSKRIVHSIRGELPTILVMAAVISPWTYRNYIVSEGSFIPITDGAGASILISASPVKPDNTWLLTGENETLMRQFQSGTAQEAIALDRIFMKRGTEIILRDPITWFKRSIYRTFRFWISSHGWYAAGRQLSPPARLFWTGMSAAFSAFGFLMIGFTVYRGLRSIHHFGMIPVYFTLVHFCNQTGSRYSVPAWPFLLCLTSFGFVLVCERIGRRLQSTELGPQNRDANQTGIGT
jgi:hypothetical protein